MSRVVFYKRKLFPDQVEITSFRFSKYTLGGEIMFLRVQRETMKRMYVHITSRSGELNNQRNDYQATSENHDYRCSRLVAMSSRPG